MTILCLRHPVSEEETCSMLQLPTTQLAKMSIDSKFVELTTDVVEIFRLYMQIYTWTIYIYT